MPARISSRWRAPWAGSKNSTTRFAPKAASATLVPLDLDDFEGIARLALALNERYQRLDILIGNAGLLGPVSPLGHVDPKEFEQVMRINVTANLQLIRCMDPLLRIALPAASCS